MPDIHTSPTRRLMSQTNFCLLLAATWFFPANAWAQSSKEPPPMLRGGLIQQLRSLSEETMQRLRSSDSDETRSGNRSEPTARPQRTSPRVSVPGAKTPRASSSLNLRDPVSLDQAAASQLPPQPTGRSVLRRTHHSPWLERIHDNEPTLQPQPDYAEYSQYPPDAFSDTAVRGGGERAYTRGEYSPRVPEIVTAEQALQSMESGVSFEERADSSAEVANNVGQPRVPRNTTEVGLSQGSAPELQSRSMQLLPAAREPVHVERNLPDELRWETTPATAEHLAGERRSLAQQQPMPITDPPGQAIAPETLGAAPRVSRVPLPRSVRSSRTGEHQSPEFEVPAPQPEERQVNAIAISTGSSSSSSNAARIQLPSATLQGSADLSLASPSGETIPSDRQQAELQTSKIEESSVHGQGVQVPTRLSSAAQAERAARSDASSSGAAQGSAVAQPGALALPGTAAMPMASSVGTAPSDFVPEVSGSRPAQADLDLSGPELPSLDFATDADLPLPPGSQADPSQISAAQPASPGLQAKTTPPVAPRPSEQPAVASPLTSATASSAGSASSDRRMHMQAPGVQVELRGPGDMSIGVPATYVIHVLNQDQVDLNGLIVRLDVPAEVTLQAQQPSHGELESEKLSDGMTLVTWAFDHLPAGSAATAPLQFVASSAKNFAVAMEWTLMPLSGETAVEVRAPRLELALEGPAEVIYGKPNLYRLHVRNPGTADATEVAVELSAEPYGSSSAEIGRIAPGEEEVIDVELTFNQRGGIRIAAAATAQTGLSSQTAIDVVVRQAELKTQLLAPEMIYYGAVTDYEIRLTNAGDADASGLTAQVELPVGASLVTGPTEAKQAGQRLTWPIGSLPAGSSTAFPLQLQLASEGPNVLQFNCAGEGVNEVSAQATTSVKAISDLKLIVNDPVAPAPVGGEVLYELQLTNRGSKAATNVKVIAQFSEGIEPTRCEGQPANVVPGQAFFEPLPSLAAGETVKLQVFARAGAAGTHRFRVEVKADEEEVRLVQEESTQYLETISRTAAEVPPVILR